MTSALDIGHPYTPRQLFELADRIAAQDYRHPEDLNMAASIIRAAAEQLLLPPLNDELIKQLVRSASAGGVLTRGGNTSQRIVKATERYYGVDGTEPLCPICGKPVSDPPCSMNSDGAFHLSHPHSAAHQGRLTRM